MCYNGHTKHTGGIIMKNGLSSVCRTLAVVEGIVGGIGVFIILISGGFLAALIGAFGILASAVPLWVLGDVLDQVDTIRQDTIILRRMLKDMGESGNEAPSRPQGSINAPVFKRSSGPWKCSCGQTNADTDQFCKNCGKYK